MEIKNLKKVAQRILQAIKNRERILLYGDTDLDGATSVIVLKEVIESAGGEISAFYFPDRIKEGYCISKIALSKLEKFAPALLISLDCGISNFEEIDLANKMGFEVIVIDHHEILGRLPNASLIIDLKQKDDHYPFKDFAAVGLAFKLGEAILGEKMSDDLRKSLLELVAIGTLADMVPQVGENKIFIAEGLSSLRHSWRPGFRAFFESDILKGLDFQQKISKIISILNVRELEGGLPAPFRLLTLSSFEEAKKMISRFKEKVALRKKKVQELLEKAKSMRKGEAIFFAGGKDWDFALISTVASLLLRQVKKPVFIFSQLENESQGTVRSVPEVNAVELMAKCQQFLISYGGHPRAAGFRLKNENINNFKKCLLKNLPSY